jgi:hypothetical protein
MGRGMKGPFKSAEFEPTRAAHARIRHAIEGVVGRLSLASCVVHLRKLQCTRACTQAQELISR